MIENTWKDETGWGNQPLTLNNVYTYLFNGYIRDTAYGNGTLAIVKSNTGPMTLVGDNIFLYRRHHGFRGPLDI